MFSPGTVHYEIGDKGNATGNAGIAAVHELVSMLGLVEEINERLELLKVCQPVGGNLEVVVPVRCVARSATTNSTRCRQGPERAPKGFRVEAGEGP